MKNYAQRGFQSFLIDNKINNDLIRLYNQYGDNFSNIPIDECWKFATGYA